MTINAVNDMVSLLNGWLFPAYLLSMRNAAYFKRFSRFHNMLIRLRTRHKNLVTTFKRAATPAYLTGHQSAPFAPTNYLVRYCNKPYRRSYVLLKDTCTTDIIRKSPHRYYHGQCLRKCPQAMDSERRRRFVTNFC